MEPLHTEAHAKLEEDLAKLSLLRGVWKWEKTWKNMAKSWENVEKTLGKYGKNRKY